MAILNEFEWVEFSNISWFCGKCNRLIVGQNSWFKCHMLNETKIQNNSRSFAHKIIMSYFCMGMTSNTIKKNAKRCSSNRLMEKIMKVKFYLLEIWIQSWKTLKCFRNRVNTWIFFEWVNSWFWSAFFKLKPIEWNSMHFLAT